MLLKHLYDFAISRNLLHDLAFSPKAVRWIIDLDAAGNCIGIVETGDGKRGKEFFCPQTTRNKNAGGVSEFLADGITAVFGLESDPEPKKKRTAKQEQDRLNNNSKKRQDFWYQIKKAAKETQSPELLALCKFNKSLGKDAILPLWGKPPDLIKKADEAKKTFTLTPSVKNKKLHEKAEKSLTAANSAWWLKTANGNEVKHGTENFTFRVGGELLIENETIKLWWRRQHATEIKKSRENLSRGICLVTGVEDQPIALTHNPKIKGVPNTQSFGAAIVSFDKPAFTSYGFNQSLNAPTSDESSTAYCTALNYLIEKEETSLRLGQTTFCFWAAHTKKAGGIFSRLLNKPDPQTVKKFVVSPWAGIERDLAKKDLFLAVTIAGNSGRVVVRHWLQQTLEQAVENFHKWFGDLEIQIPLKPHPKIQKNRKGTDKNTEFNPLSIYWLSASMAPLEKKGDIFTASMGKLQPEVPAQLYRAAFENSAPSISLIKPILNQFRSRLLRDEKYKTIYDQSRFALLKLIINRNRKDNVMEIKPQLTADTDDPAYNCGRLLAVLAEAQKKAHDYKLEGAGVVERYFGSASVSPSSVFPLLFRLNRHHLDKIRKSDKWSGGERFLEEQIRTISTRFKANGENLPPIFPRHLDLQAQGRFALGFYQQQAADVIARDEAYVLRYIKKTDETKYSEIIQLKDTEAFWGSLNQYRQAAYAEKEPKKPKSSKELV